MSFKKTKLLTALAMLTFPLCCGAQAQLKGYWQAASNNANNITGDIAFSDTKVIVDFKAYAFTPVRVLQPAEVSAVFDADVHTAGNGNLIHVNIPASQRFLHKNTLCGDEDTQWIATYLSGRTLHVAFFSGATAPVLTFETVQNSTDLCGAFSYVR